MVVVAEVKYKSGLSRTFHVHEMITVVELAKLITLTGEHVKQVELKDGNGKPYNHQNR